MIKCKLWIAQVPLYAIALLGIIFLALLIDKKAVSVHQLYSNEKHTIFVIDAGHGGEDGGAISCTGIPESAYNLKIAIRLEKVMQLLGYRTCMTRTTDTALHTEGNTIAARKVSDLKARISLVNAFGNAVLISIHQNYFAQAKYRGTQVFYAKGESSEALAKGIQRTVREHLMPENNREAKKAEGIYLMDHITNPGILIECGFLSNPEEEMLLRNEDYQKLLTCVIASGLAEYLIS